MNASRIRARAEGKLARAKKGHARRLRRKLGEVVEAPVVVEAPATERVARKAVRTTVRKAK